MHGCMGRESVMENRSLRRSAVQTCAPIISHTDRAECYLSFGINVEKVDTYFEAVMRMEDAMSDKTVYEGKRGSKVVILIAAPREASNCHTQQLTAWFLGHTWPVIALGPVFLFLGTGEGSKGGGRREMERRHAEMGSEWGFAGFVRMNPLSLGPKPCRGKVPGGRGTPNVPSGR